MNHILIEPGDYISPHRVQLDDRRFLHLRDILKVKTGQTLQLGELGGLCGTGVVTTVESTRVEIDVTLDKNPPPPHLVKLMLALPRPKALKRILQGVTAMGVKEIRLVNSWRVEKSYWQTPLLQPANLAEQCKLGLEQARDTIMPEIILHRLFKPFVEDELPSLTEGHDGLLADPYAEQSCPTGLTGPTYLAIGPEGGFIPFEIGLFKEAGMQPVHLGERPLRVESAVPALLGRLARC